MARTSATNYSSPGYQYATADADGFDRLDVAGQGQSLDGHDHSSGKGLPIPAAALAVGSITNAKLASDTARANLLTNGGFEIWQRGNGPFSASSAFTADRWQIALVGSDTLSVSKDTANPDASYGGASCAACTFTLSGGGGVTNLSQRLAWADVAVARPVTLSIRIRTSTANAVRIGIHNGSAFSYSAPHSGSGAYETLSVTATLQYGLTSLAYVFFAASCTAYIDNAMLVVGSVPADYAPLHPADDLARCLRYYEPITLGSQAIAAGMNFSTTQFAAAVLLRVPKAVAPTLTVSAATDFSCLNSGGGGVALTALSGVNVSALGLQLTGTVAAGLVAGNATVVNATLAGARLVLEANP